MKYTNRADLLIAAGESIKMQEKAGIEPMYKYLKGICQLRLAGLGADAWDYEFPLAVVEGKPVFVGDELYHIPTGSKYQVQECKAHSNGKLAFKSVHALWCDGDWVENYSLNPPKPKTVMVELLVEDAELLENECRDKLPCIPRIRISASCREALENLK